MALRKEVCAYCGVFTDTDEEHVIPKALFDPSIRHKVAWRVVRSCRPCNVRFSKDDQDFANFCVLASKGDPHSSLLFNGPMLSSWTRPDGKGKGQLRRLKESIVRNPEDPLDGRIYPGKIHYRAVRKIVRGLCNYHFTESRGLVHVVPDAMIVTVDAGLFVAQTGLNQYVFEKHEVVQTGVCEYYYAVDPSPGVDSSGVSASSIPRRSSPSCRAIRSRLSATTSPCKSRSSHPWRTRRTLLRRPLIGRRPLAPVGVRA